MTMHALALNADHQPLKIIPYQRAVNLVLEGTAYLMQGYEGVRLHAESFSMEWPAVIALYKYVDARPRVKFTRGNLLARDRFACQYGCGPQKLTDLTLDHVVPRAHAVRNRVTLPWNGRRVAVTCWENVVAACGGTGRCNHRKGARTPGQAGMKLIRIPKKPSPWDCVLMPFLRKQIPSEWMEYVPADWRGYWDTELDAD